VCKIACENVAARDDGQRDFAHAVGRSFDCWTPVSRHHRIMTRLPGW